jgi:tRNA U34 5-methylaminomethyl-2-thiouridine-forming methyltransferase MnmC
MNVVNERKELLRFARRARARQGLVRAVDVALRALFYALCISLAGLIAAKVLGLTIPIRESVIALAAIVGVAALIALFFPRKDLLESAAEVDLRAGWKERLSSALALPALTHPMEFALIDDVREKLKEQKPSRLFPLRAPRELKLTPVIAIAIAAVSYFVPQVDLLGYVAREKEKRKDKEEISLAIEKLEKRKKELEKNDKAMDKVKDAIKKIDALAVELQKNPPPDRKEAIAKITNLNEELKQLKDELSKGAALAEKLQKAASDKGGETGELGKLFREGKFAEAVQELAKMRNALQEGKMSPAEREKLRREMEALQEKLSKDKDLQNLEKKLAEAMKGMQDGDEKGLDGLQKELGKMESELNESEQLAEAMKDLENLSDALAKGEGECPKCGEKKGKCKCHGDGLEADKEKEEPGDGLGEGQGYGTRPETPADFDTEKTKVKSKLGKGTYVGSYFMKGEPPKGEAATRYSEVERAYAEEAMDALNKQKIPATQRDYVRDYFDAIRLEKTGKSK